MARNFIGVDIGGTSIKLGIVTENGEVLVRKETIYTDSEDGRSVMQAMTDSIRELIADQHADISDFSGIGVSAAGCINSVTGSVAENGGNVPGWSRTEVTMLLREEFGLPASLANDANCAVLGEFWKGAASGCSNVVGVTLGTGVGGGVITGGRLLEGAHGYAGELGHFTTHAGGEHCVCGLDGCFERYASTSALIRRASSEDPELKSGRILFGRAADGDRHALGLLEEWIDEIAYGITGLVHIFDPELVLIGGGVSAQEELLIEPLKARVISMVMPDFAADLEFRPAALGNDAGLIGAVYYFLSKENISRRM